MSGLDLSGVDLSDVDLAGVHPLRLATTRLRIAAIKSFIAAESPDDIARRAHADAVGLSINQFLGLVRAWREHGRAAAISGAGTSKGATRPTGPRNLPAESKEAARSVVASLGANVSHVDAVAAVKARCAALEVRAPSRSTIWNMVMAARREAGGDAVANGLVVSRCHVKLPVERDGVVSFPSIILAVNAADGSIPAAAIEGDQELLEPIRNILCAQGGRLDILVDAEVAAMLGECRPAVGRAVGPSAARTATARVLGRGFGSIELVYQLSRAVRPERVLRSRKDHPLNPQDARSIILEQLSAHNAARGAPPSIVSQKP